MSIFKFLILFLVLPAKGNEIKDIYDKIFMDYNPSVQPIKNVSVPTKLRVQLGVTAFRKLEETGESMVISFYFMLHWVDEHLRWNPSEHNSIDSIVIPAKQVWTPDLQISNSIHADRSFLKSEDYKLEVRHTGEILWYDGSVVETHCTMDVRRFPFDTQTCSVDLMQWASTNQNILLIPVNKTDITMLEDSGSWTFISSSVGKTCYGSNKACFQMLKFYLTLERKPGYFIMVLILPICLLTLLNIAVFFIPPDAGEKISMSVSVLLSYSVLLTTVSDELPEISSNISLLSVFISAMLCVLVFTTSATVAVVNICHRPKWIPIQGLYVWLAKYSVHKKDRYGNRGTINGNECFKLKDNENYSKEESDSTDREYQQTWKDVALGLDRFLLAIVCVADVIISITCIVTAFYSTPKLEELRPLFEAKHV